MKIRILAHSIRLRLQQNEVQLLHSRGQIEEETQLGPSLDDAWRYTLKKSDSVSIVEVTYNRNRLLVQINPKLVRELAETDRIGIEHEIIRTDVPSLFVLIEKDFKCLTPRDEDEDGYPHPESHSCM